MDIESFRLYCLDKRGVTEEFPFDESALVFKVMGKIFAITNVDVFASINLKVDPEELPELMEQYTCVQPGYHMNKKHWMTVAIDGSVADRLLTQWIDRSYHLVVNGLTKKQKVALEAM